MMSVLASQLHFTNNNNNSSDTYVFFHIFGPYCFVRSICWVESPKHQSANSIKIWGHENLNCQEGVSQNYHVDENEITDNSKHMTQAQTQVFIAAVPYSQNIVSESWSL